MLDQPKSKPEWPRRFPTGSVVVGAATGTALAFLLAWLSRRGGGSGGRQAPGTGQQGQQDRAGRSNQPPVPVKNEAPRPLAAIPLPAWPDQLEVRFALEPDTQTGEAQFKRTEAYVSDGHHSPAFVAAKAGESDVIPALARYIRDHAGPNTLVRLDDTRDASGRRLWTDEGQSALLNELQTLTQRPNQLFEWVPLDVPRE